MKHKGNASRGGSPPERALISEHSLDQKYPVDSKNHGPLNLSVQHSWPSPTYMSREKYHRSEILAVVGTAILNWVTPQTQLRRLADNPGHDNVKWEDFRDTRCRKWVNLSVTCGLIMGAVATILFSKYPLRPAAFTLAAASLLSGLIASGIAVGLIYVLGDLKGSQYKSLKQRHPVLFAFALVLPQMWALICFASFYFSCALALWDAVNKSWIVKAGVSISTFVVTIHLVVFVYTFSSPGSMRLRVPGQG